MPDCFTLIYQEKLNLSFCWLSNTYESGFFQKSQKFVYVHQYIENPLNKSGKLLIIMSNKTPIKNTKFPLLIQLQMEHMFQKLKSTIYRQASYNVVPLQHVFAPMWFEKHRYFPTMWFRICVTAPFNPQLDKPLTNAACQQRKQKRIPRQEFQEPSQAHIHSCCPHVTKCIIFP